MHWFYYDVRTFFCPLSGNHFVTGHPAPVTGRSSFSQSIFDQSADRDGYFSVFVEIILIIGQKKKTRENFRQ